MAATAPRASTPPPRSARATTRPAGSARRRRSAKKGEGGFSEDGSRYAADDEHDGIDDTSSPSPSARPGERGRTGGGSPRRLPLTIEGELVAKSTGTVSAFTLGDRVFHQKFGNGNVTAIDGNKLTIQFDRAGREAGGG